MRRMIDNIYLKNRFVLKPDIIYILPGHSRLLYDTIRIPKHKNIQSQLLGHLSFSIRTSGQHSLPAPSSWIFPVQDVEILGSVWLIVWHGLKSPFLLSQLRLRTQFMTVMVICFHYRQVRTCANISYAQRIATLIMATNISEYHFHIQQVIACRSSTYVVLSYVQFLLVFVFVVINVVLNYL